MLRLQVPSLGSVYLTDCFSFRKAERGLWERMYRRKGCLRGQASGHWGSRVQPGLPELQERKRGFDYNWPCLTSLFLTAVGDVSRLRKRKRKMKLGGGEISTLVSRSSSHIHLHSRLILHLSKIQADYSGASQLIFFKPLEFKDNNGISSVSILQEYQYIKY